MVNIGSDWMNSQMSTVNVVERPVAMNFYPKVFPGLGGAILFGNFNLGSTRGIACISVEVGHNSCANSVH